MVLAVATEVAATIASFYFQRNRHRRRRNAFAMLIETAHSEQCLAVLVWDVGFRLVKGLAGWMLCGFRT